MVVGSCVVGMIVVGCWVVEIILFVEVKMGCGVVVTGFCRSNPLPLCCVGCGEVKCTVIAVVEDTIMTGPKDAAGFSVTVLFGGGSA